MSRFGNPHLHYNNMNNNMQQNMQQPMMPPGYPVQQMPMHGYPMQQPMMPPGYPMQQMPMHGYPMQQPMMPPGYPMQQMPMQGYPVPQGYPLSNRFGQTRGNMSNSATDVRFGQNVNINTDTNRFENNLTQPVTNYSPSIELNFENFNPLTKGKKMEKLNIVDINDEVCVDCFEEAVEHIIECYYKNREQETQVCVSNVDVLKVFYNTSSVKNKIIKLFEYDDIEFSKNLIKLYNEQKEKESILALKEVNNYFTEEVNEWCFLNINEKPSIDSFSNDYSDLLDVISNLSNPVKLREFVTNKINIINEGYKVLHNNSDDFGFINLYTMCYLNLLSTECDLNKITTDDYIYLPRTKNNQLFISIADIVFAERKNINYFILVTMDRKVFKIIKNNEDKYYITLV